ncbi:MAG: amidase family protein, partial [Oleibacter sp.]|nr:amidase family protein [Thalassolituus sp.]
MTTEWAYHSGTQLLEVMNKGELTSRALVEYYQQRFAKINPDINAIVATNFDAAFARANEADQARKDGVSWGPLHGLPITIKDTFEVIGMPCTAGAPTLKNHLPKNNAQAVELLLNAGAIIFGKTNTPLYAGDIQSYNDVYGTTNNPWDLALTPGGSSGGSAAALATGMTPIELGSDIGGSIRTPANFCGIYGHKVTYGITSSRGHIPGPPGMLNEPDLSVAGPMARSVNDLKIMLDVISGPSPFMTNAWQLNLPEPTQKDLSDFKVLMWLDDPLCPIDDELRPAFLKLKSHLEEQGARV